MGFINGSRSCEAKRKVYRESLSPVHVTPPSTPRKKRAPSKAPRAKPRPVATVRAPRRDSSSSSSDSEPYLLTPKGPWDCDTPVIVLDSSDEEDEEAYQAKVREQPIQASPSLLAPDNHYSPIEPFTAPPTLVGAPLCYQPIAQHGMAYDSESHQWVVYHKSASASLPQLWTTERGVPIFKAQPGYYAETGVHFTPNNDVRGGTFNQPVPMATSVNVYPLTLAETLRACSAPLPRPACTEPSSLSLA